MAYFLMRFCALLVFIAMLFFFAGCGGPEKRKIKYYDKGISYYQKGDYQNARLEAKNAVKIDPEYADGFFLLAKIEFEENNFNRSRQYCNKVLKLSPDNIEVRLLLAQMALLVKEFDYALEKVREVQTLQPENKEAKLREAYILISAGDVAGARKILKKLLSAGDKDPDVYVLMAATYSFPQDMTEIEKIYHQGLTENKDSVQLKRSLAGLYVKDGKTKKAVELLESVVALEPRSFLDQIRLAQVYLNMGKVAESEKIINNIVSLQDKNDEILSSLVGFLVENSRYQTAEQVLIEALSTKTDNAKLRFLITDVYMAQGKFQEAISVLEEFLHTLNKKKGLLRLKVLNTLGRVYLASGQFDMALQYAEKAISLNPNDLESHFTKGKVYLGMGQGQKAVTEFRVITTANPDFIEGHLRLAEAYVLNKNYDLAVAMLQSVLKQHPESKEILRGLALTYLFMKDDKAAEVQLRKIIEHHPNDVHARLELGDMLFARKELGAAEEQYKQMMTFAPENSAPYLRLSKIYLNTGRKQEAVALLEKAQEAERAPSFTVSATLIDLYIKQGQYDKAVERCLVKLRNDPNDAFYRYLLGLVFASSKKFKLAEEELNKAIDLSPSWSAPQYALVRLYFSQGESSKAIKRLEEVVAQKTEKKGAFLTLALLYEEEKDYVKAMQTYERALEADPDNWVAANNLAYMLMNHKDDQKSFERALALAQNAKKLKPDSADVADTLSWAYYRTGKHAQALNIIEETESVPPEDSSILYHRAAILFRNGKVAEARDAISKALGNNDEFNERAEAHLLLDEIANTIR